MPRLSRLCPVGIPQHLIQRGNNRSICFGSEKDLAFYTHCLKEYSKKFKVNVHAWVFMTNHVHLLVTPLEEQAVSRMMQSVGRVYVGYFNKTYSRTGTLWEGRFKSCLVDSERYLLACYRYIELNPVVANMVQDPAEYFWSSYQCNALGKQSDLLSPHSEYLMLGKSSAERQAVYRSLFKERLSDKMITDIRQGIAKGMALGSDHFKAQIEHTYNQRVVPLRAGRPKKSRPVH